MGTGWRVSPALGPPSSQAFNGSDGQRGYAALLRAGGVAAWPSCRSAASLPLRGTRVREVKHVASKRLRLSVARKMAGFTQEALAERLDIDRSTVGRWEAGETEPQPFLRPKLAMVLGVSREALSELLADSENQPLGRPPETSDDLVVSWDAEGVACLADAADTGYSSDSDDGDVLRGARLTGLAHEWLLAEPEALDAGVSTGGMIDHRLLDRFEALVHELSIVDDHLGGGQVLALVHPEVRFAVSLMRQGSFGPASRRRLYRLIGELARLAGWAAYDDGRHALAQRYYQTALAAAHVAGDRLLSVYVLSLMAFQASDLEQYREALLLLDSARLGGRSTITPGVHAMLDSWEARAHSIVGDRDSFRRALGNASEHFGNRRLEDDPSWLYWFCQPEHLAEMCRGHSLVGDHQQGIAYLSDRMGATDDQEPESERDLVLYHAYAAEAFLGLGDLDAVATEGHQALDLLGQDIASSRATNYVTGVARQLLPHQDNQSIRDFLERVTTVVRHADDC